MTESKAQLESNTAWDSQNQEPSFITQPGSAASSRSRFSSTGIRSLASTLFLCLIVLLSSLNFFEVFGFFPWSLTTCIGVLCGGSIAYFGFRTRIGAGMQILFLLLAQFVAGPVIALPNTTITGFIPTLETLARGVRSTVTSFKYVISVEPPLDFSGGELMALWTLVLWASFLAVTCALNRHKILDLLAIAIIAAELTTAILLGTASGFYPVICGALLSVALLIWVSWHTRSFEAAGMLSAAGMLVIALALALVAGFFVPAQRTVLRNLYEPPISLNDYTSPLSQMRAFVKEHKDDELLSVTDLPEKTPVRLAVMDSFDGTVWNLSDSSQSRGSADYLRMNTSVNSNNGASERIVQKSDDYTATFTVHTGLSNMWLPLAGNPTTIQLDASSPTLYFNSATSTALTSAPTYDGMSYRVSGTLPYQPSEREIAKASAAAREQPSVSKVPKVVSELAQAWTGSAGANGASAAKLSDQLKSTGWFSHGLVGDYPSLAGHGAYRVSKLLDATSMVGDSEQYASAMALLTREIGLSSRVVMGFIPKDESGTISASRTEHKGTHTSVSFTGNDVEAWVEIYLKDYGWVSFYPTPEETKIPDENQDTTPPDPQTLVRQPSVPLVDPLREPKNSAGTSLENAHDTATNENHVWENVLAVVGTVALYGSPIWILLLLCLLILLVKVVRKSQLRRRGSPQQRFERGWAYLIEVARWAGLRTQGTRRQQARSIEENFDLGEGYLGSLSEATDFASFSGAPVSSEAAHTYWDHLDRIEETILHRLSFTKRWRAKLSLAGILRGIHSTRKVDSDIPPAHSTAQKGEQK